MGYLLEKLCHELLAGVEENKEIKNMNLNIFYGDNDNEDTKDEQEEDGGIITNHN